jgi:hypothetical protein
VPSSTPHRRVPEPREVHRRATLVLSAVMLVLGLAIVVVTVANGGGPLALGILVGVLFAAAGAGRLYVTWRRP